MFSFRAGALALIKCCQRHARPDPAETKTSVDPTPNKQEERNEESYDGSNNSDYEVDKTDFWRRKDGKLKADDIPEDDDDEEQGDDDNKEFDLAVLFPLRPEEEEESKLLSPTLGPTEHCVLSLCYYATCRQSARAAEQFLNDLHAPFCESRSGVNGGDRDREALQQMFQEQTLIANHNYASARDKYYRAVRRLWDLTEMFQNQNQVDHIRFIWSHVIVLNRFTQGPREDPLRYHRLDISATLLPSMGDNPERT